MKPKKTIYSLFILLIATHSFAQYNRIFSLSGPEEVCPGTGGSGPTYTYHAYATDGGCFYWSVYEDGQWYGTVNPPCGCSGNDAYSSFSHEFQAAEGNAIVQVTWIKRRSIFCRNDTRRMTVERRVFGPGQPYDADGGDLSICSGQTKTVYIPGVPGPPNSESNCYWHHKWDWTAPTGWSINGQSNTLRTGQNSVQVSAPNGLLNGFSGFYPLSVQTEPSWQYPKIEQRQFWVGSPATPSSISGTSSSSQGAWEYYQTPKVNGASSYAWVLPPGWSYHSTTNPNSNEVLLVVGSNSGYVRVKAVNDCGSSNYKSKYVTVSGGCNSPACYSYSVAPNPANESITISATPIASEAQYHSSSELAEAYRVTIFDQTQNKVLECESNSQVNSMDVSTLNEGIYYIHIHYGDRIHRERLVITH